MKILVKGSKSQNGIMLYLSRKPKPHNFMQSIPEFFWLELDTANFQKREEHRGLARRRLLKEKEKDKYGKTN